MNTIQAHFNCERFTISIIGRGYVQNAHTFEEAKSMCQGYVDHEANKNGNPLTVVLTGQTDFNVWSPVEATITPARICPVCGDAKRSDEPTCRWESCEDTVA